VKVGFYFVFLFFILVEAIEATLGNSPALLQSKSWC